MHIYETFLCIKYFHTLFSASEPIFGVIALSKHS